MKRHFSSVIAALALIALVLYGGYQIVANLTVQIQTVDALEVTVEEKVSARGWFVRQQTLVGGQSGGTAEYLVSDGDKVAKGQELAVFFNGDAARQSYNQAAELESRLSAVEYAYSMITSGTDSMKMDQLIFKDITELSALLADGDLSKMQGKYASLQQLVVSRGSTEDNKEAFEGQIRQLKQEIAEYQKRYASGSSNLKASAAGYFTGGLDGYETVLTVDRLDTVMPSELKNLQPDRSQTAAGAITTGFCWYFAVPLTREQASGLQLRDTLTVYFPEIASDTLTMEVYRLESYDDGSAILILKSDKMKKEYLTAREQDIDIIAGTYTGLKVPSRALRQKEGEWGVYVLEGSIAQFKPVTWNYQTDSYYLVPCADSAKEGLYRYDRVIVRGRDLADDKVIHR